jgi:xanthine dehydrogenase accessory factor
VRSDVSWGTIGGGQLEYLAIEAARELLIKGDISQCLDLPLGPEIGQCCGGRVEIMILRLSKIERANEIALERHQESEQPMVYVFGAGHVGRALADLLQYLPVHSVLVDQRENQLASSQADVEKRLSVVPEFEVMKAPKGSAFIVLTHDHGLDFLLTSAALERGDAAYVGMIGSATKRANFASWAKKHCDGISVAPLICPIWAGGSRDKRPAVIASQVVAEVITALTSETTATRPRKLTVSKSTEQPRTVEPFTSERN